MGAVNGLCCQYRNHDSGEIVLQGSPDRLPSGRKSVSSHKRNMSAKGTMFKQDKQGTQQKKKKEESSSETEESSDDGVDYAAEALEMQKNFKLVATVGYNQNKSKSHINPQSSFNKEPLIQA